MDSIRKVVGRLPFGLITDVDGTISRIAPTPREARVSPSCRRYLSILSQRLSLVAAVSGRKAEEAVNLVGLDRVIYIGNHGLERWVEGHSELREDAREYLTLIQNAVKRLTQMLPIEGIRIEDKGITATVHYRLCPDPRAAERKVRTVLESLPEATNLRIIPGKMAINIMPPLEANKGTAVSELIKGYNLHGGIYLGDDVTDVDAFRAMHTAARDSHFHGLAIAVDSDEMPENIGREADFTLNGVNDVERFLKWLSENAPGPG